MQSEGDAGPEWYVTNGERVVGPIATGALVHGIATGVVGESCLAWHSGFPGWRPLDTVREVRALVGARAARGEDWVPSETWKPGGGPQAAVSRASLWMDDASDEDEVVTLALQAMVLETRATVGYAHRPLKPLGSLETRAVFGEGGFEQLGGEVVADDAAIRVARRGVALFDVAAKATHLSRTMGSRLSDTTLRGLALAPIYLGGKLVAVIEIAKRGRPFRNADTTWMRAVAQAAARRMAS